MILTIEELSANAFPALSTLLVNGWILRFAEGYAKRANSVSPLYPCGIDVVKNVELCEKIYLSKKLNPVFKLTECENGFLIDNILQSRGYEYEAKTNILLKDLSKEKEVENAGEGPSESAIEGPCESASEGLSESASEGPNECTNASSVSTYRSCEEDWFEAFTRMNKVSNANKATLRKILNSLIPDAFYGFYKENNEILAVGLGVMERGFIGMFDIYVDEAHRRKGLATKIMNKLISEGVAHGCDYSYLQVIDDNENAKLLYKKLGYEKQYSYWYRVKHNNL